MTFLNGSGKRIDTIFPDTYEYFESLAALVEREPADAISPSDLFLSDIDRDREGQGIYARREDKTIASQQRPVPALPSRQPSRGGLCWSQPNRTDHSSRRRLLAINADMSDRITWSPAWSPLRTSMACAKFRPY
jgi:hypothetical protein